MKTVYLAGPMRGMPEHNFPAFHAASGDLRSRGFEVWSPAEYDEGRGFDPKRDTPASLASYMEEDLAAVCRADAVVVLPGWEGSQGARLEVQVARALEIPVLSYPELEPVVGETVLEEAQRLVYGTREHDYGHPADDFERTAKMWSAILGVEVSAKQAALCMAAVKISRECHRPQRDNLVDLAGYAAVVDRISRRARGLE